MSLELNFVIPGWYKSKNLEGDITQTIRVMGGGEKEGDYFALMDGKEMHEREILDNWEYMPTAPTQDGNPEYFNIGNLNVSQKPKTVNQTTVYDELNNQKINDKLNSNEFKENFIDYQEEVKKQLVKNNDSNQTKTNVLVFENISLSNEEIFIDQLLKQVSGDNDIVKKSEIQFNSSFEIPIMFNFKYDLQKLKQILKLIGTEDKNINLLIHKIISNDFNDIKKKINESIKDFLLSDNKEIIKTLDILIDKNNDKKIEKNTPKFSDKVDLSKYLNF